MDGVLFYNWFGKVNGSLINAFEYFISIFENNPNIYLCFINCNKQTLHKIISVYENRYDVQDLNYKKNIILIDANIGITKIKFDKVLVLDYSTIYKTRGLLRANEVIVIQEYFTDDIEFQYNKKVYNVKYYGEMPHVVKDYQYRMKFLFNRFKPLSKVDSAIYINSPKNNDYSFIKDLDLPDKPIIYKSSSHKKNLFEHFDTYVYYHANKYFDPHPKLFHECKFYGKELFYFNPQNIKDGSYYRWKDLNNTGLKNRTLNGDDEIVNQFI